MNDGGPAFPCPCGVDKSIGEVYADGMSLRAYIATACLQGLLSQSNQDVLLGQWQAMKKLGHTTTETAFAHIACSYADALIAQLQKEEK